MKLCLRDLQLFVGLAAVAFASCVGAQSADFPSRPITIVVPYSAGGAADIVARTVGKGLSDAFKQPVIVDNKPGAAGQIGAGQVSRAPDDGYTLLLTTDNLYSINPALYGKAAQATMAKLVPVVNLAEAPLVLVANAKFPANTIPELITYAKSRSEPLTYATSGNGTPHHLAGESLARMGGIKLLHVPYKGTAAGIQDVAGGQVDLLFGNASSVQSFVDAGRVKILAVTSPTRFELMPNTPAIAETIKGFETGVSFGLMAPAGTPANIIDRLNADAVNVLGSTAVQNKIKSLGMIPKGGTPADYAKAIKEERQVREKIIAEVGVKAE